MLLNVDLARSGAVPIARYNIGELMKVRGKISDIQNEQMLYLLECELL